MKTYSVNSYSYSDLSEKAKLVALDSVTESISRSRVVWADKMAFDFQDFLENHGFNVSVTYNLREGIKCVDSVHVQLHGNAVVSKKDESENIDNRYFVPTISIMDCHKEVMKDFREVFGDEYLLVAGIRNELGSTPIMQVNTYVVDDDFDEFEFEEDDKNALLLNIQERLKEVYVSVTKEFADIMDETQNNIAHRNGAECELTTGHLKGMEFYETGHIFESHDTMIEM